MAKVVVVGSLNMDLVMRTARLPQMGETWLGGAFSTAEGGKGANQAVACARMGASVALVGRVGRDDFGRRLVEALVVEGVDVGGVRFDDEHPTGMASICGGRRWHHRGFRGERCGVGTGCARARSA